jgi:hypothetical protein
VRRDGVFFRVGAILLGAAAALPAPQDEAEALRVSVETDWELQERGRKRTAESPVAIRDALKRATRIGAEGLEPLAREVEAVESLGASARLDLYRKIRGRAREQALRRIGPAPIVFMKRRRFICQMLHEYLGYFYDPPKTAGGGVFVLEEPGRSLRTRDLLRGRLPEGHYTTLALSHDARNVYFAYADHAAPKPDFYAPKPGDRFFRLHAVSPDGQDLRRLTNDPCDDFDPCPLPDGGIAFMSIRRGGFTRCNNPWEPITVYTLHRMDSDGRNIRTISFHETNEWHPGVLPDGRIAYSRWDYVDRSAANFHGIWAANPDGSAPAALFGNYTVKINACYQPRGIPGSNRIAFIAGAHHADVGGSLVLLDPSKTSLDPGNGRDRLDSIEVLTPEVCFPEGVGWPKTWFHSPWPLSEDHFLVSYSHDPLPGMSSKEGRDTETGLYYFDRHGNLELLYRERGISCMYPIPLVPRAAPPVLPDVRDRDLGDEGEFLLADVNRSLYPMPEGRPIRELRVFQVLPKTTHIANKPQIGHANAEGARMLLGTVPVEADGSAYFRAPARKALYFQAVDADGRAVQGMRSVTYLQPGERRGCVGCHEPPHQAPPTRPVAAALRPPSRIAPGPDGTLPFSYPRLVQPVLDRNCARCHGAEAKAKPSLTGEPSGTFSRSYVSLKPCLDWLAWGKGPDVTKPGKMGADASRLLRVLEDANHRDEVRLDEEDRRRLRIWLDGNVPFYGTYGADEQAAQREGRAVPPPAVQ